MDSTPSEDCLRAQAQFKVQAVHDIIRGPGGGRCCIVEFAEQPYSQLIEAEVVCEKAPKVAGARGIPSDPLFNLAHGKDAAQEDQSSCLIVHMHILSCGPRFNLLTTVALVQSIRCS